MAWGIRLFHSGSAMGNWGESVAARYLRKQGCRILGRNVRPIGKLELDIIAQDSEGVYLFIEVKTRAKADDWHRPLQAITLKKRRFLRKAAMAWLFQTKRMEARPLYRFDAVEVVGEQGCKQPEIHWVQGLNMDAVRPRGWDY